MKGPARQDREFEARIFAVASMVVCALGFVVVGALVWSDLRAPKTSNDHVGAGIGAAATFLMGVLLILSTAVSGVLALIARRLAPNDRVAINAFGINLMAIVATIVVVLGLLGTC